jgi:nitrogen fixation protein FixH
MNILLELDAVAQTLDDMHCPEGAVTTRLARTALQEQLRNSAWQPIETAPNDKIILLYRPTATADWMRVTIGKHEDQRYAVNPRPYWGLWIKVGSTTEARMHTPTHWMPLPEPPQ